MRSYTARLKEDQAKEPERTHYTSNALKIFTERLESQGDVQALDVGPVCGENINFFARRVKRLFISDLFRSLDSARRKGLPQSDVRQHLDYPSRSFDGIALWGLLDYLEDQEIPKLVEQCVFLLRPSGLLLAVVQDEHAEYSVESAINSYVISEDFGVLRRPQPHLTLPSKRRNNRALLAMMDPFIPLKSFIYRDGIREILFRYK